MTEPEENSLLYLLFLLVIVIIAISVALVLKCKKRKRVLDAQHSQVNQHPTF